MHTVKGWHVISVPVGPTSDFSTETASLKRQKTNHHPLHHHHPFHYFVTSVAHTLAFNSKSTSCSFMWSCVSYMRVSCMNMEPDPVVQNCSDCAAVQAVRVLSPCSRRTDLSWLWLDWSEKRSHSHHGNSEETTPHLQEQVLRRWPRLTLHSVRHKHRHFSYCQLSDRNTWSL